LDILKQRKIWLISAIIFLALVLALSAVLYWIPAITEALTPTYIVESGVIESSYTTDSLVVRNEQVIYSPSSGTISYYVKENEKTRIGTLVADVYYSGNKTGLYCPSTGFICYYTDGLESVVTPDTIANMEPEDALKLVGTDNNVSAGEVHAGDIAYKLVDGGSWYLYIPISRQQLSLVKIGSNISIELEDGTVLKLLAEKVIGKNSLAILTKVLTYYPEFTKVRHIQARIVTKRTEGLQIPNSALATEDGFDGVYVLGTDNDYHFTKVQILASDEENSIVTPDQFTITNLDGSTKTYLSVSMYDEILKDGKQSGSK